LETYVRPRIEDSLRDRGRTISEAKTRIVHRDEGFNFLGFHIRRFAKRTLSKPRKEKVLKHLRGIKSYLEANKQVPAGKVLVVCHSLILG
jgi:RNA-directed DNA polymerase